MLRLVCVALMAAAAVAQLNPVPQAPTCDRYATSGGHNIMPHEKYCQMFYMCDLSGKAYPTMCPQNFRSGQLSFSALFAFGEGIGTCVYGVENPKQICPNWPSTQNDVNARRKYPDVCCNKYWEVTAINTFEQRTCPTGQQFSTSQGLCQSPINGVSVCQNALFYGVDYCINYDTPVGRDPTGTWTCKNRPNTAQNDPCTYFTEGFTEKRKCPHGTQYSQDKCGCHELSTGCSGNALTAEQLRTQKQPDSGCRASGRVSFSSGDIQRNSVNINGVLINKDQPKVYSDKLKVLANNGIDVPVDHFFTHSNIVFSGLNRVQFNGAGSYLYDYYYVDNPLYATFVITMKVKFDFTNNAVPVNTEYMLLQNQYYSVTDDGSVRDVTTGNINANRQGQKDVQYCNEPTIWIKATFIGNQQNTVQNRQWRFEFGARPERDQGIASRQQRINQKLGFSTAQPMVTTGTVITTNDNDEIRVTYVFSGNGVSGTVQNQRFVGSTQAPSTAVTLQNTSPGQNVKQIGTNKCGFMLGRNFLGSMSEFSVFEGCSNPNANAVTQG